jgi:hypothetical protein
MRIPTWLWDMLHGVLWGLAAVAAASVFVLAQGCHRAWGGEYLTHGYPEGYTEDNYTYKGGLFWRDGKAYTRNYRERTTQVPYTAYSYSPGGYGGYGSYATPYTAYRTKTVYYWDYVPVAYPQAEMPSYGKNWQDKLLSIAANRDKLEGNLRTAALDHQAYISAVNILGLAGNFRLPGYGTAPAYPSYSAPHAPYAAPYAAAQGNTLYGYSYANVKDLYGDTNLSTLYQQAARLTQNAQTLAGQGHTDFSDLVGREGANRARVAEVLAKAQAAAQVLAAANPQASQHTEQRTFSFRLEQGANGASTLVPVQPPAQPDVGADQQPQPGQQPPAAQPGQAQPGRAPGPQAPPMPRDNDEAFRQLLANRCAQCHGDKEPKGAFRVSAYATLSPGDKMGVWRRIMAKDSKRMPPPDAGPALTQEEIRMFLTH